MMNDEEIITTEEWKEYERGKSYNMSIGLYTDTEQNYDFYYGKQWKNAKLGNIQPITLNIIRPIVKAKIGVLNDNLYQIVFNPNFYENKDEQKKQERLCKSLNRYCNKIWEIEQINQKVREALKDSCINSEGILHSYEEDENIKVELIDKPNMYLGNENDSDLQQQPYIIITYRKSVESVKEEAKRNGMSEEEISKITSDSDYETQPSQDKRIDEISPMCLVLLKYYKKNGTVWIKKTTKTATIKEEADTGLKLYPVAHMVWEEVKGYSRGNGEVKYLIPNQIEINKTATRRSVAVQLCAYPKMVVNKGYITNTKSLEKVGATIEVDKIEADDVNKVVSYLRPTTMSQDAFTLQKELMNDTQDLAGAGDAVSGNVDPTKASGTAILAVQQAGQKPLNEQVGKLQTFIEDIARIWYEMIQNYSMHGITVIEEEKSLETEEMIEVPYNITQEELKALKFNIKVDITPHSAYDKYAQEQSLENLLVNKLIEFDEYVGALSDDSNMPKSKLEKILRDRDEKLKKVNQMKLEANKLDSAMNQVMQMQMGNANAIQDIASAGDIIANQFGGGNNEVPEMQTSRNAEN